MPKAGPNLKYGSMILVVVFVLSSLALYGLTKIVDDSPPAEAGDEELAEGEDGGGVPGGPVTVRLVAKDLKFDKRSVSASPGGEVTAVVDNQDAGVLHNVAFYTNSRATQRIFAQELFPGAQVHEAKFTAPAQAGNYYFRCDAHPDTMNGTFSVR